MLCFFLSFLPNIGFVLSLVPSALLALLQFGAPRAAIVVAGWAGCEGYGGAILARVPSIRGGRNADERGSTSPARQLGRDDLTYEGSLRVRVGLTIRRIARRQRCLERRITIARGGIPSERVAEGEMLPPEGATQHREVQVVAARLAAPEEFTARDPLLTAMLVASADQRVDVRRDRRVRRIATEEIEDGLGGESGDGGAPNMFERDPEVGTQLGVKAVALGVEEGRPGRVVGVEPDDAAFES